MSSTSDRRRLIIDALASRHGITHEAAQAALRLGQELRARTIKSAKPRRREHAGMIDAQAGTQLGSLARGQIDGVDIARQVYAARGRRAVSVHTHPHSSSFSPADANLLSKARDVCAVVVVGADGTWYLLSIEPGKALPADATIEGAYRITRQSLIPKYLALVQSQAMTRARAWQEHSHEVWERIAPVLGLRYDRIEVKRKK